MLLQMTRPLPLRLIFSIGLVVTIAVLFWGESRYPSLNDKALVSGSIQLEDPLSFEAAFPVHDGMPMWQKIGYTTLNWIDTNTNGMIFGVLFGGAFLTLLRYLPRRSFSGWFANSALGLAIGAPLGVCVNCAAPIAKGIYSAGARAETTLSAMIASPTLNVVVLTMVFSIMPFYIAVTKLALSIVVILFVVPLVVRLSPQEKLAADAVANNEVCALDFSQTGMPEPFAQAVIGFCKDFARDLWFILSRTVPMMFAAGFLGAVAGNLLPLEDLKDVAATPFALFGVSLLGVFLPVPIGFDVVVAGTLLNAGLPVGMVMVLLFSLGIFSVYSFIIIGSTITWRTAALITGAVVIISVVAGLGAEYYQSVQIERTLEYLTN
jgi:uncharacterized membrane protein YraQ (UPF0718 family)